MATYSLMRQANKNRRKIMDYTRTVETKARQHYRRTRRMEKQVQMNLADIALARLIREHVAAKTEGK